VPVAFVLTGAAVAVVAMLLAVTDWACQAISGQAGPNSNEFFHDVAGAFSTITDDGGAAGAAPALFVALLASAFAALAALAVWVELLIRSAGIYVCVLFFPVVLVARIWPKLEKWATRLAEALTALILSKFVIVAVLSVAAAAVANPRASEGFNGVLAAGALLVFAAFAPLVLFRLVQFADPHIHSRGGSAGTVARSSQTTMSAAQSARMAMDRHAGGGGSRGVGAADMARSVIAGGAAGGAGNWSSGRAGANGHPARATGAVGGALPGNGRPEAGGGNGTAAPGGPRGGGGAAQAPHTPATGRNGSPPTAGPSPGRETGTQDRRPADLGPPGPSRPGERERGDQ
jgi:hypothetical protein